MFSGLFFYLRVAKLLKYELTAAGNGRDENGNES